MAETENNKLTFASNLGQKNTIKTTKKTGGKNTIQTRNNLLTKHHGCEKREKEVTINPGIFDAHLPVMLGPIQC